MRIEENFGDSSEKKELDPNEFAIWWLSYEDNRTISKKQIDSMPDYIKDGYRQSDGRAGRGRRWSGDEIKGLKLPEPAERGIDVSELGGVIIKKSDIDLVKNLPGKLTNLDETLI